MVKTIDEGQEKTTEIDKYIDIILEEYKNLRSESVNACNNMFSTLQWGAALLGISVAGGLSQWGQHDFIVLGTLFIIIPFICSATMFIWLGEATRMRRVGLYLITIENKLKLLLPDFKILVKSTNNKNINWKRRQTQLEKALNIVSTKCNLAQPLVWEQYLHDIRMQRKKQSNYYAIIFIVILFIRFARSESTW